jgi:hypothetical protein
LVGMCSRLKKRPCRYCGKWFWPDVRVGPRQRTCSDEECQCKRRAETQATWRRRNPEYAVAYRMQMRAAQAEDAPGARRHQPPLDRLPWDFAKDQFTIQGCEFIEVLARVLLARAKDEIRSEVAKITRESAAHPPPAEKDQTGTGAG